MKAIPKGNNVCLVIRWRVVDVPEVVSRYKYANDVRLARDVTSLDDENFVFHYAH